MKVLIATAGLLIALSPWLAPKTASVTLTITIVDHSAMLNWQEDGAADVSGFEVYRSTSSGGPYTRINDVLVNVKSYFDATVTAGKTYYYVVTAVSPQGDESARSNEAPAIIPSS
jgi:fibronectin type 3 domain-containing protein